MAFVFAIPQFSRGSAFYVRPLDPRYFMNINIKKELEELHLKLSKEIGEFQQPIPLARIAKETNKTEAECERQIQMMRKIGIRSALIIQSDHAGQKCVFIKISPEKVAFRKPQ
jgi:hypothetical protein